MINNYINRRQFLKASGSAAAGAALVGSVTLSLLTRAGATVELPLTTLNEHQGRTLLTMARHLYPHDTLDDSFYAVVVEGLDQGAAQDPALAQQLQEGVAALDSAAGGRWLDADAERQLAILKDMESTPFFQRVRGAEVVSLYNQKPLWGRLGYEGEAFSKGGYLQRGFNDLDWLANPPASASPKPY